METGKSLLRELEEEEYRIRSALKALGYYVSKIIFYAGSIRLEVRDYCEGDDELMERAAYEIARDE